MSLDKPTANKMMRAALVQKEFHFASDGIHMAEFVEAATIEDATEIYHRIKRPIGILSGGPEQQSTGPAAAPKEENALE